MPLFLFKATPHNDCCAIAPSDFSSDCLKSAGNTLCIAEHFWAIWRKRCKQACNKGFSRSLRGVAQGFLKRKAERK
jgi:hypothetical protein